MANFSRGEAAKTHSPQELQSHVAAKVPVFLLLTDKVGGGEPREQDYPKLVSEARNGRENTTQRSKVKLFVYSGQLLERRGDGFPLLSCSPYLLYCCAQHFDYSFGISREAFFPGLLTMMIGAEYGIKALS